MSSNVANIELWAQMEEEEEKWEIMESSPI